MRHNVNSEQIAALKPDEASFKAAKGLLAKGKWANLGYDESAIWGECQGSGSKPYLVQMRVADWVFKCTCPSRKFPCKHGLALGLLFADSLSDFSQTSPPTWVQEWLTASNTRAEKKRNKEQQPVSEQEQAQKAKQADKRRLQRHQRLQDGLDELQLWLIDQLRYGLNRLPQQLGQIKQIAARMVDAQMPLIAKKLQDVHDVVGISKDWPLQALKVFGQLQLIIEAFSRFEQLNPLEQADLLDALGAGKDSFQQPLESVYDVWVVVGVTVSNIERQLWRRMVWLQGHQSNRCALLVDFNYGGNSFAPVFLEGQWLTGQCHYFSSTVPLRVTLHEPLIPTTPLPLKPANDMDSCLTQYARQVAVNPWAWVSPWWLQDVWIYTPNGDSFMVGNKQRQLPLHLSEQDGWSLLAAAGTLPLMLFLQFTDGVFTPLSAWRNNSLLWKNEAVKL